SSSFVTAVYRGVLPPLPPAPSKRLANQSIPAPIFSSNQEAARCTSPPSIGTMLPSNNSLAVPTGACMAARTFIGRANPAGRWEVFDFALQQVNAGRETRHYQVGDILIEGVRQRDEIAGVDGCGVDARVLHRLVELAPGEGILQRGAAEIGVPGVSAFGNLECD